MTAGGTPALDDLDARVIALDGDVAGALELARELGRSTPRTGSGRTAELWSSLATVAAADVTAARVIEPHLDARDILDQADAAAGPGDGENGEEVDSAADARTWGVFAAEGGGSRLEATGGDDGWRLTGSKPWCSLASRLSDALITAWLPGGGRSLFAISLNDPGVRVIGGAWHAVGLADVASGPIELADAAATPVGGEGWYLDRPGFAWGGIGVAACWWGGAVGVGRALVRAAERRAPDQIALHHLGAVDLALTAGRLALDDAARAVDDGDAEGAAGAVLALRTRGIVAATVETVLAHTAHALGPAPLALDARHARRVADLSLYVRQQHAERDDANLGQHLIDGGAAW